MTKDVEKSWWLSWWQSTPNKSDNEEAAVEKGEANDMGF